MNKTTTPPTIPKRKRPRPSRDRPYTRRFNSRAMGHISNPPTVPNNHCPTLRHFPPRKESGAADQFLQKFGNLRNETLCWRWIERAMEGSNKTPYEPSKHNNAGRTCWLWKGLTRPLMSPTTKATPLGTCGLWKGLLTRPLMSPATNYIGPCRLYVYRRKQRVPSNRRRTPFCCAARWSGRSIFTRIVTEGLGSLIHQSGNHVVMTSRLRALCVDGKLIDSTK